MLSKSSNQVDHETGAFADYIITNSAVQMHIPAHMSFQDAATLGVSTVTVVGQDILLQIQISHSCS